MDVIFCLHAHTTKDLLIRLVSSNLYIRRCLSLLQRPAGHSFLYKHCTTLLVQVYVQDILFFINAHSLNGLVGLKMRCGMPVCARV